METTTQQTKTLHTLAAKLNDREMFIDEMEGANAVAVAPAQERVFIIHPDGSYNEE